MEWSVWIVPIWCIHALPSCNRGVQMDWCAIVCHRAPNMKSNWSDERIREFLPIISTRKKVEERLRGVGGGWLWVCGKRFFPLFVLSFRLVLGWCNFSPLLSLAIYRRVRPSIKIVLRELCLNHCPLNVIAVRPSEIIWILSVSVRIQCMRCLRHEKCWLQLIVISFDFYSIGRWHNGSLFWRQHFKSCWVHLFLHRSCIRYSKGTQNQFGQHSTDEINHNRKWNRTVILHNSHIIQLDWLRVGQWSGCEWVSPKTDAHRTTYYNSISMTLMIIIMHA